MAHIKPNPGETPIMIKTIGLLTRKDGWTHDQFMKHWIEIHAELVGVIEAVCADCVRVKLEARQVGHPGESCSVARNYFFGAPARGEA